MPPADRETALKVAEAYNALADDVFAYLEDHPDRAGLDEYIAHRAAALKLAKDTLVKEVSEVDRRRRLLEVMLRMIHRICWWNRNRGDKAPAPEAQ